VVGVWCGPRPGVFWRSVAPPELAWYRSHWLPGCDGARARVTADAGVVRVEVPWLESEPAERIDTWSSHAHSLDRTNARAA
jgi:hypothetical protein